MRKVIFSIFVVALSLCSVSVMAQKKVHENRDSEWNKIKGPYETNRFFDNLFIGFGGGVNLYTGEKDTRGNVGERIKSPSVEVYIGKWFTPSIGGRFAYNGIQAKGWTENPDDVYARKYTKDGYNQQKFAISYLHGDFMWNISNAIGGYRDNRTWSFVPFIGAGWVRSWRHSAAGAEGTGEKNLYKNDFAFNVGLLNNVRLCKVMDLTIEVSDMFACHDLDLDATGSRAENMLAIDLGLSFKINRMFYRVRTVPDCDYTPYEEKIAALEDDVDNLKAKHQDLEDENEELRNRNMESEKPSASPVVLFFEKNKSSLDSKELTNLDLYMDNAESVDSDKTYTIVSDGNEDHTEYVYNLLVDDYGVSEDHIVVVDSDDNYKVDGAVIVK